MDNLMHDMSGSASPVVFNFAGKTLVAVSQKEAVLRILDANNLGGQNHMTPLWQSSKLGNDEKTGTDPGRGVWGAIATYETNGRRFLYLPLLGHPSKDAPVFPVTNGPREDGSIMAFEVMNDAGKISRRAALDLHRHGHARSAGGGEWRGLCAVHRRPGDAERRASPAIRACPMTSARCCAPPRSATWRSMPMTRESGKQLWSSGKTLTDWVHFSEPVVALGKIFVVTHDAHVVAFGLKK